MNDKNCFTFISLMIGADSLVDFDSCQTDWVWPFPAPQNFTVHSVYSGEKINGKQVRDLTKTIWYYCTSQCTNIFN